jgi:Predicted integral membrane protein (DUF2275)/Putative zinc-finger
MEHSEIKEKLSAYMDDALTEADRIEIGRHIGTCKECSNTLSGLKKTVSSIKALEEVEPPAWLTQKIMAGIKKEAVHKKSIFERFFFPLHIKLPLEAFALIAIGVTTYFMYRTIIPGLHPPVSSYESALSEAVPGGKQKIPGFNKAGKTSGPYHKNQTSYKPESAQKNREKIAAPSQKAAVVPPMQAAPAERSAAQAPPLMQKQEAAPAAAGAVSEQKHAPYADTYSQNALKRGVNSAQTAVQMPEKGPWRISLTVKAGKLDTADNAVKDIVSGLGGKVITTETLENSRVLISDIGSGKADTLLERLKNIGGVQEKTLAPYGTGGTITVRIEILTGTP